MQYITCRCCRTTRRVALLQIWGKAQRSRMSQEVGQGGTTGSVTMHELFPAVRDGSKATHHLLDSGHHYATALAMHLYITTLGQSWLAGWIIMCRFLQDALGRQKVLQTGWLRFLPMANTIGSTNVVRLERIARSWSILLDGRMSNVEGSVYLLSCFPAPNTCKRHR